MCLKPGLFPVLTLPNLTVKAFYVLIFSPKACVLIFEQQRTYVLIKNWCRLSDYIFNKNIEAISGNAHDVAVFNCYTHFYKHMVSKRKNPLLFKNKPLEKK